MMNTPIYDFVKKYAESECARFHMPGHKGKSFLGCESLDITEISGADVLYSPDGIIAQSENNATALFKTGHTFYSTEGSTLAIKAMLALIKKRLADKKVTVLAARNAHKAFIYACALLDIDVEWIYSTEYDHLCSCKISPSSLSDSIKTYTPDAVYLTSPDYLGTVLDISGLATVCHSHGIPLLVDNAHGAYLAFTEPNAHPIQLGADMCCDSAHKTLPVLTGGAYLHVSKEFDASERDVRNALSLFASTSPSYLILQSLDLCNSYLSNGYARLLAEHIEKLEVLRSRLAEIGFPTEHSEPLKLVFSRNKCGYDGNTLASHLRANKIEPEFADRDTLVLMSTPENTDGELEALFDALSRIERKSIPFSEQTPPRFEVPRQIFSLREAMLASSETMDVKCSLGRVCAAPTVSCPPAIPIVMSGEQINESAIELMLYYGINEVDVVKE